MVCTKGSISMPDGEVCRLRTSWNGKALDTATAYAAPSFPTSGQELFTYWMAAMTVGGTIVQPTTTALASGGTAVTNIKNFSLDIDNKLDTSGFALGSAGKQARRPILGTTEITGRFTAEYDSNTYRDLFIGNTAVPITLTLTSATSLQSGVFNTLQIVLPSVKLDGDIPKASRDGVVTLDCGFTVLDGGTAGVAPVTVVMRNLDTVP